MEQLQYDVESLEHDVAQAIKQELIANSDVQATFSAARSPSDAGSFPNDEELAEWLSCYIAHETAKVVVSCSDYDPDTLAAFFGQGSGERSMGGGIRNVSKANALPSWAKPLHKHEGDLTNCVITGWPGFDRTLQSAARAAVKDATKSLTTMVVSGIAAYIATTGNPEAAALAQVVLTYIGAVVSETMASLATVAFSLQRIDSPMQCVYQRAMRIARNGRNAAKGELQEVTVKSLVSTFLDKEGNFNGECSELYHTKAPRCPFCSVEEAGQNKCMLVNPALRPADWDDDESAEEKVRRILGELKALGVLSSRLERSRDSFFRSNRLITSYDTIGGR